MSEKDAALLGRAATYSSNDPSCDGPFRIFRDYLTIRGPDHDPSALSDRLRVAESEPEQRDLSGLGAHVLGHVLTDGPFSVLDGLRRIDAPEDALRMAQMASPRDLPVREYREVASEFRLRLSRVREIRAETSRRRLNASPLRPGDEETWILSNAMRIVEAKMSGRVDETILKQYLSISSFVAFREACRSEEGAKELATDQSGFDVWARWATICPTTYSYKDLHVGSGLLFENLTAAAERRPVTWGAYANAWMLARADLGEVIVSFIENAPPLAVTA